MLYVFQAFRRQGIRQLQSFLTTAPHLFNDIVLEMYRRDPTCIEVLIHPHLKTLEVNSKSLPLVLEYAYNLTNVSVLYLFFDINRCAFFPFFKEPSWWSSWWLQYIIWLECCFFTEFKKLFLFWGLLLRPNSSTWVKFKIPPKYPPEVGKKLYPGIIWECPV